MTGAPVLEARSVRKAFGHVQALDGASLSVFAGEVVGLVGDNGAGKSSLIKVVAGALAPDEGELLLDGEPVELRQPADALRAGIETVYQDLALAPDLDAIANLFLGRETLRDGPAGKLGLLAERRMRRRAPELLDQLGIRLPALDVPVGRLSGGQRQIIAVARSIVWARRVVLMDEPTAALGVTQTQQVDSFIRAASARGIAVVVISHNLPELLRLVDRVVVLRLGRDVAHLKSSDATATRLMSAMTGLDAEGAVA